MAKQPIYFQVHNKARRTRNRTLIIPNINVHDPPPPFAFIPNTIVLIRMTPVFMCPSSNLYLLSRAKWTPSRIAVRKSPIPPRKTSKGRGQADHDRSHNGHQHWNPDKSQPKETDLVEQHEDDETTRKENKQTRSGIITSPQSKRPRNTRN